MQKIIRRTAITAWWALLAAAWALGCATLFGLRLR